MHIFEPLPAMQSFDEGVRIERIVGRTDTGKPATAPGLAYVKMIDPAGNVVPLVVRTTRNLKECNKAGVDTRPYGDGILRKKLRRGWLSYDDTPADQRERIIADRQVAHREASAAYATAWASQDEKRALQSKQAMDEALVKFTGDLSRMLGSSRKNG
jgi:hypothetical protein